MRFGPLLPLVLLVSPALAVEPVPDKLVVLTFDDAVKSHFTTVRPILKKHKFSATFFVTEGFDFKTDKENYMSWQEIRQLHEDGFEIGNHTRDHQVTTAETVAQLPEQLEGINERCKEHGIPRPTSFAYPGNGIHPEALPLLEKLGVKFARRGGMPEYPYEEGRGVGYRPGLDHPLLIPSAGDARPDWTLENFRQAVQQAQYGRIAVLQFHGVPDKAHPWVHTPVERFEEFMQYLADHDYKVIAMRDLEKYVDRGILPKAPFGPMEVRKQLIAAEQPLHDLRPPADDGELRRWLENMVWYHRFSPEEIRAATGLPREDVQAAVKKFNISEKSRPKRKPGDPLVVLPYPGGRHPRIGFLDGAMRPARETKVSVFSPWNENSYFVLDIPEAIRRNDEAEHGLLYLAHAHVPTMWTKRGKPLAKLEWTVNDDGSLVMERRLPNGVVFGTKVIPGSEAVRMEMWLINGSDEMLSNLRVQNCIMFRGAPEFAAQTNENKVFSGPYAACQSAPGDRWLITAWSPGFRTWGNPPCPCMHSDPQFPDCAPGETKRLYGWLSFYEGSNVEEEFERIEATGWRAVDAPQGDG